ncbi:hypothetical protein R3W88_019395 [Solanum pinnatisectum]|uniref:BSD domain-containing protein n=1 Tax=Solanum pinnatisectum TaxID=50273 RepID=A0AAV9KKR5_9SOLN|nr:hypothetical protein R3W88_019395 [Solanum pinnatisectum]
MSWLSRSLANSLRLDEEEGDKDKTQNYHFSNSRGDEDSTYRERDLENRFDNTVGSFDVNEGGGVKEDLSELKQTLTRQLWGVSSFLASPPPPPPPPVPVVRTVKLDLNRIESVDRSNLSGESEKEYVGDYLGYSNYEEEEVEDSVYDAVGVTNEALTFARNIAHHPETWLDFSLEEEEFDDFEISETQQKHAFAVERLAPGLAALRIELCPVHMTEGYFWMVYFVLLHTRLNKHDAELLSTPQLVEARSLWMQELQKKTKPDSDFFGMNTLLMKESTYSPHESFDSTSSEDAHCKCFMPQRSFGFEHTTYHSSHDIETEKLEHGSTKIQFIDESIIVENPPSKILEKELVAGPSKPLLLNYDEHEDDWVQDIEESECYSGTGILMGNEEEISFSDLEDDIDCSMPVKSKLF